MKETNKVMEFIHNYMKTETEVVLEEVRRIINLQDETKQAIKSVLDMLETN